MELHKIEELLEKYFEAQTTTSDETILHEYFRSENVAPSLKQYVPLFGYYADAKQETTAKEFVLSGTKKRSNSWLSVAASIVVLIGVGIAYFNQELKSDDLGTYDDPEIALQQTQKALSLLSSQVNKGVESVDYIGQFDEAKDKVFTK